MNFRFDHPALLALLLLSIPIVWLGRRSLAALEPGRRWLAMALRVGVLVLITLMLAGLQGVRWHNDLTVVAVIDRSESVRRLVKPPAELPWATAAPEPGAAARTGAAGAPTGGSAGAAVPGTRPATVPGAGVPGVPGAGVVSVEQWINAWLLRAAKNRHPDDRLGVVTFDAVPSVRAVPSTSVDLSTATIIAPHDGTDIASAIRQGLSLFPPDSGKRLVLVSDGNDNASGASGLSAEGAPDLTGGNEAQAGEVLAAAREARASRVPIDVVPLTYNLTHEVMVDGVYAPPQAVEGQTVSVRVVLRATQPTPGWLYLKHDGLAVAPSGPGGSGSAMRLTAAGWSLETQAPGAGDASGPASGGVPRTGTGTARYARVVVVEVPLPHTGVNRFEAIFDPDKGYDTIEANNRGESFTVVRGRSRVLVVDADADNADPTLSDIITSMGVAVDQSDGTDLPDDLSELLRYDAVVLQNIPSAMVPTAQQALLSGYVTELGGGLLMLGGPNGFGAGDWADTPVDRVLPVDARLPGTPPCPVGALLIVIDRSGSMSELAAPEETKLDVVIEAAIQAAAALRPHDMVEVVTFDTQSDLVVPLTVVGPNLRDIATRTRHISIGGGTDIYEGLRRGFEEFMASPLAQQASTRHMLLMTDGQSEGGDYQSLVAQMKKEHITISTIGVGDDVNPQFLTWLAGIAGGTYHPITDPTQLPQVFVEEANAIRGTFIKEVSFRPRLLPTGSPITRGLAPFPLLKGLVVTSPKRLPQSDVIDPRVFMPLVGPDAEPLLAYWQVGLGRTAAFTSDASNRWAPDWLRWSHDTDFWARTIRTIARPAQSRALELTATARGATLHLKLEASGPEATGALQAVGTIVRPDETIQTRVVLHQTGPGLYEGDVPAADEGNYIVSLLTQDAQGQRSALIAGANRPPGMELRSLSANDALLREVAQVTGGRVLDIDHPDAAGLFGHAGVQPVRSTRPLWQPLLIVLLAVFLLDVAARRVAWDPAQTWRWIMVHLALAAASREAGAAATLATLKVRATQVQEGMARLGQAPATSAPPHQPPGDPGAPTTPARSAAPASPSSQSTPGAPAPPSEAPAAAAPDPTTSRLLDAKRRIRERLDEEADD